MTPHPRLSVSQMCTYSWSFDEELALWDELGVRQVGVILQKIDEQARAALKERSMTTTTVIIRNFDLAAPETWDATRAEVNRATDLAAELGGSPYFTPGPSDGHPFADLAAALAQAVAPCVAYAESQGVRLAIEPTARADRSFVHTLRDGIEVAEQAGVGVVADLGACWTEPDFEDTVRRAGSRIALVQIADAVIGTSDHSNRAVPGDGDLDIGAFIEAVLESGYTGAFELELVGLAIEAEGHASATRRAVEHISTLLDRALSSATSQRS
jgi:sugar phosphate isomerase/epimerase